MKILVAYDGTLNAKDVLRYGVFKAKTLRGTLEVLHVVDSHALSEYSGLSANERSQKEAEHYLDEVRKIIDEAGKGLKVSFITSEGDPYEEIISYAKDNKMDLILVPQRYASIAKKAPCSVSVVPRDFSTFKVLLVDDEEAFVKALAMRLNLRNLHTEVVLDGDQAIAFVKKFGPDVIVLDLRMPGMDGIEVLRETKKMNPDVQVIILSGRETPKDREEAKKLGAFDFVTKPAEIDMLAGRVKEAYWTKVEKPPHAFPEEA
jgi:CheY-like chemotaxis protein